MKVMLFGDSHLAAVRSGLSLVDIPQGLDLEFWGTAGNRFRHISWVDGKIVPDDEKAANAFSRFNQHGKRELDPSLYDAVVFIGARIRPGAVVPDLLNHIAHPDRYLTRDYIQLVLAEHFLNHTTYQMARLMAATGKTRVLMNMISFYTYGKAPTPRRYTIARRASRNDLALLDELNTEILRQDNITHVGQPLDTIAHGCYTDAKFGLASDDYVHKNAEYGAVILRKILDKLQQNSSVSG